MTLVDLAALRQGATRFVGLDRLRGLAIMCMVVDHVCLLAGVYPLRVTVGRLALPLFMIVGGSLVRELTWRHGGVLVVGLVLPVAVPWIDAPNILVLYVLGAALVSAFGTGERMRPGSRFRPAAGVWVLLVLAVGALANGWGDQPGTGYPWAAVVALMALGALAGRRQLAGVGDRLPHWLAWPGRHPLSLYVGHLLVLQALVVMVS